MAKERILFVDDEEMLLRGLSRILKEYGYWVVSRASSVEALELFRSNPNHFDLVITDMKIPRMTGAELAKEMMAIRPDIPIIMCTGYIEMMDETQAIGMGIKEFVVKPFSPAELLDIIRKVLEERASVKGAPRLSK
jgi:DNA-binding NtrC family response regulator